MLNLRRAFQAFDEPESSAALTPWFKLITPRLVLCMDGSLLGGFEYEGRDIQNCPPALHEAIASTLQQAVRSLDHRCTVWAYTDKRARRYTQPAVSDSPLGDYAYNALREVADGPGATGFRHYIYVSIQPFQGALGFLDQVAETSKQEGSYAKAFLSALKNRLSPSAQIRALEASLEAVVNDFEAKLRQFGNLMASRCSIHALEEGRLLGALASRYNVLTPTEELKWPEAHKDWFSPAFLNTYLPTEVRRRHANLDYAMVHEGSNGRTRYSAVLSFKSLTHADSDLTEILMCMPWEVSVGSRFKVLEEESTRAEMRKAETHYRDNVYGLVKRTFSQITGGELTNPDLGMAALADGVADALREQGEHHLLYGFFSQTVQVFADTEGELLSAVEAINAAMTNASGVPLILERMGMLAAQMLMLPGTNGYVFRQYPVSTRALACMLALRTITAGKDVMPHVSSVLGRHVGALLPLPTVFPVPHLLNPFVGDLGHFAIIGAPGNGKTTLINLLLLGWSRVPRARAFVLDIDGSSRITISALGGQYSSFEVSSDGVPSMRLAPAKWIKSPSHHSSLAAWLKVAMTAFEGDRLNAEQVTSIEKVIGLAHTAWTNAALSGRPHEPTLGDLYELLVPIDPTLAVRLRPWIRSTSSTTIYAAAFDHAEDDLATSDVWGVDISGVMKDEALSAGVLAYVFAVVDETLEKERPTLGYAAELATVFKNKTFATEFENWLRRFRKRNCFVGFDAHAASDISGLDEAEAFQKAIKTWYLLPNPSANSNEYAMQKLEEEDAASLRDALPKRHYLLVQEGHKRLLDLALPPHLLVLTRSDDVAKATFDKHVATQSPQYLKNYADELIERDKQAQQRFKRN